MGDDIRAEGNPLISHNLYVNLTDSTTGIKYQNDILEFENVLIEFKFYPFFE